MKSKNINSVLFITFTLTLAVLTTAYIRDKTYMLNFYILPILFGAYYYDIYGGIILAVISSGLGIFFAHRAGLPITDTPVIVKLIIFTIIGLVAGIMQRENNRLNNYLFEASLTDKLTDLYNYGHFDKRIKEEIARADRYNRSVGLIMIDIDHFKEYNDTYGHEKGNQVLGTIAKTLKNTVKQSDVVFRYGGEEFAVILPETREQAVQTAEKLKAAVENEKFPGKIAKTEHLTISAGVSYHPWTKKTHYELVERADNALYLAKNSGRNRVCIFKD